jgi:hypothetical protein
MSRIARSTLRAIHSPAPKRARPWWTRRVMVALTLIAVALPVLAVATQFLSHSGPGWYLYALHDGGWLPFWSVVWVQARIWSLMWWVPLLALAGLALAEFLGLGQPLRSMQVAVLRRSLRSPLSPLVLAAQQRLGWGRNREGLLVAVLESELLGAESALRAAAEARRKVDPSRAARLMTQLAYLRATDPARQVRCGEGLMLIGLFAESDYVARLRAKLCRIWPEADGARISALLCTDPTRPAPLFDMLKSPGVTAPDLALATLAMARGEALVRADLVRLWFGEWARLRHDIRTARGALPDAERLIAFEFWAARAEAGLALGQGAESRNQWLAALLPGVAMRRPMGELAAIGRDGALR